MLAEAVLWLLLLLQLARFGWLLLAPASVAGAPRITALPAQIPDLAGHAPFSGSGADTATASASLDGWRLFGLRSAADGGGSAILGRDKQPQMAYAVGDEIAPGLALARIADDHVEFGDGRRLDLPDAGPAPAAARPAAPLATARAADAAGFDTSKLLDAGLQARTEDGRITGYTLLPRGGSELMLRGIGLRPGDVLLSVNGQFLSPGTMADLARELQSNPQAVVSFQRDGQTRTLTLGSGKP
ncbi:type II secretion system protein N [Stenotrophomonas sp. MMGLT7]|uniref:type II secretion system protein N n=1 Tax=Stenotrophomonas sp. MMGLT7 TaxID=2901227 RepID=UPI001E3FDDFB|nr:type II secretion system protein N [Stenotrophomonas sp. MMGLT7]MCD7098941.1 PDZ domain-containing protein [Stenotrophomonas sp. MMGLT7]